MRITENVPRLPLCESDGATTNFLEKTRYVPHAAVGVGLVLLVYLLFSGTKDVPLSRPVYHLPPAQGGKPGFSLGQPVPDIPVSELKVAEHLLLEGARALNHDQLSQAVFRFRQAVAMAPGHPKYQAALDQALRLEARNQLNGAFSQILARESVQNAWTHFDAAVHRDPGFFFEAAPMMAKRLFEKKQNASCVAILTTYCRQRPGDKELESLLAAALSALEMSGGKP
jgi:hypothetical protein